MWDKGQGGGIVLFFLSTIPLAVTLSVIATRLIYVTFHLG